MFELKYIVLAFPEIRHIYSFCLELYVLLVKHPMYMEWILKNTGFKLNDDEEWLKAKVDLALECARADRLIFGLRSQLGFGGVDNIENPHWCVE